MRVAQDTRGWRIPLAKAAVTTKGTSDGEVLGPADTAIRSLAGVRLLVRHDTATERDEWGVWLSRAAGIALTSAPTAATAAPAAAAHASLTRAGSSPIVLSSSMGPQPAATAVRPPPPPGPKPTARPAPGRALGAAFNELSQLLGEINNNPPT